ncbi:MAG: cyclic GMP-AMP synthase DncV-like nucleotidyltransferase [Rhodothermales bacterium]
MSDQSAALLAFQKDKLQITATKESALIKSREDLRTRIRNKFVDNHSGYEPKFFIQGSYKNETLIRTKEDTCDLDDGVYFLRECKVSSSTLQRWVHEAVDGHTSTPAEHKEKCVRVIFAGDYHIDFPVYRKPSDAPPELATKSGGWQPDDPREFVEWFSKQCDSGGQLRRIVRYMKAWADSRAFPMPSGLALSILAARNQVLNDREDVALLNTLLSVRAALTQTFTCPVPALPYDDLFGGYDADQKAGLLDTLDHFIRDASAAVKEDDEENSGALWFAHLGPRFATAANTNGASSKKAKLITAAASIVAGNVSTQADGTISLNRNEGVPHKPHKFYGG